VLATTGVAAAQEGVVRVSDADSQPAVIKMNTGEQKSPVTTQTAFAPGQAMAQSRYGMHSPQQHFAAYAQYYGLEPTTQTKMDNPYQMAGYDQQFGGQQVSFAEQQCATDAYYSGEYYNGCDTGGWGGSCDTGNCNSRHKTGRTNQACNECYYGDGYNKRVRLLAGATPKGSCDDACYSTRWWRGQQINYQTRNQRLSNCLFGWMVPSGCCGQGCPPFGKYHVTYADDPGYADSRDGQAYGAQGYGVPMTVPLAPNVRYSYNYSSETPSSRLTPIGQYDPQTSPQSLYGQSW